MTELKGRHKISLGSSITNPSTTSLHALKYNFQPSTIDHSRPSTLSGGGGGGDAGSEYTLTVPSKDGTSHFFKGPQTAGKDIDCLLIYDERNGTYVLEQVGSTLRMDHQRHAAQIVPTSVEQTPKKRDEEDRQVSRREEQVIEPVLAQTQTKTIVVTKEQEKEEQGEGSSNELVVDEDDDDDLDDFANMLESTLDESSHKEASMSKTKVETDEGNQLYMPVAKRPVNLVRIASREDESSEDED